MNKPEFIIVHHSDSPRDTTTLEQINQWHKSRGFPLSQLGYYVGYHKVITGNGVLHTARNDNEVGAHAKTSDGMNYKSIGICLTGNFNNEQPTPAQLITLRATIESYRIKYNIPLSKVLYHGNVAMTECCGKNLKEWVEAYKKRITTPMIIFKVACAGTDKEAIQNALNFCSGKLQEWSGGKLGVELALFQYLELEAGPKMVLTDDQARHALEGLTRTIAQCAILNYKHSMARPWYSTQYIAGTVDIPIIKAPYPFGQDTILFELGHALIQYYNENRDRATMPSISNVDNYDGGEQIVKDKVTALMPYLSVFAKKIEVADPNMLFEQIRVDGGDDVYLVRDLGRGLRKTLVRNQNLLMVVGDFTKIKVLSKDQINAIPDEDFGNPEVGGGSVGWEPKK